MNQTWQILKPGDTVQLIAPASKLADAAVNLKKAQTLIRNWKLKPLITKNIFGSNRNFPELANTDEKRFADLKTAIENPEVKAIWCVRGGYGCGRLLKFLDREFKQPPLEKIFIGYSDITVLNIYFNQAWGWKPLHAGSAIQIITKAKRASDGRNLHDLMFGIKSTIKLDTFKPLNQSAKKSTQIYSSMIGGNLTLIARSFGTPYELITQDKIIFIEEVDEPFRKVDGYLMQWQMSGLFDSEQKPRAIIFGSFSNKHALQKKEIQNSLIEFAKICDQYDIPVLKCNEFGHEKNNCPIPIGTHAKLVLGKKSYLEIEAR